MQTSPYHLLPKILDVVAGLKPRQILDIGCGDGFIGLAIRRYVGNEIIIDGVDSSLRDSAWIRSTYRHLEGSDIRQENITQGPSYDLVLLLETLHGINKREGKKLLKDLIAKHHGVLVSASRDQWDKGDFAELGNVLFLLDAERNLVFISKDVNAIKTLRKNRITTTLIRGAKTSKTMTRLLRKVTSVKRKK
ncbi:MAG: class I SAM-dependent methyltransferase [Patescibacteria group bacterium]